MKMLKTLHVEFCMFYVCYVQKFGRNESLLCSAEKMTIDGIRCYDEASVTGFG